MGKRRYLGVRTTLGELRDIGIVVASSERQARAACAALFGCDERYVWAAALSTMPPPWRWQHAGEVTCTSEDGIRWEDLPTVAGC